MLGTKWGFANFPDGEISMKGKRNVVMGRISPSFLHKDARCDSVTSSPRPDAFHQCKWPDVLDRNKRHKCQFLLMYSFVGEIWQLLGNFLLSVLQWFVNAFLLSEFPGGCQVRSAHCCPKLGNADTELIPRICSKYLEHVHYLSNPTPQSEM